MMDLIREHGMKNKMSQLPSKTKYTYYKNAMDTWTVQAPTDMNVLNSTGLNLPNELLAKEVVEELNASIEFGMRLERRATEDRDRTVSNY